MNSVVPDDHSLEILKKLHEITTVVDGSGRVMGYFTPKENLKPEDLADQPIYVTKDTTSK
jgi:hypothetical protein